MRWKRKKTIVIRRSPRPVFEERGWGWGGLRGRVQLDFLRVWPPHPSPSPHKAGGEGRAFSCWFDVVQVFHFFPCSETASGRTTIIPWCPNIARYDVESLL